jgi:signal transduction histidine kinase
MSGAEVVAAPEVIAASEVVAAPAHHGSRLIGGMPARLAIAAALAVAVAAGALALRASQLPSQPAGWLTPLTATGLVVAGLLARIWAPGLAWAAFVVGSLLATAVPVALARAVDARPHTFEEWLAPALGVIGSAVATAMIAALDATRLERRAGSWVVPVVRLLVGWFVVSCVILVALVWAGARADPSFGWSDVVTLPITLFVQLVLLLLLLGIAGDVRPALARADRRLAASDGRATWQERIRATIDELTPGVAARHDRDVEAERRRLAGDLHAAVLPSLRRAISEVEQGAGPELLAERLRAVDLELQRMLSDLWPVVLETFGLVEALEDLAERAETDALAVQIDVGESSGRPPAVVERAAYRIAQLACDNAVRHASARLIRIEVTVTPRSLRLAVVDDGRGLDAERLQAALRAGSHGMSDVWQRAEAVGGLVSVSGADGGGTAVRFEWTAGAGNSR